MAIESLGELFDALSKRDWNQILGTIESEQIEFKSQIYNLAIDTQGFELAKDVAAMCNTGSGAIILGFKTQKQMASRLDVAATFTPVPRARIDDEQILKIIETRIYPSVRKVKPHWFDDPENLGHGIFVLEIPTQEPRSLPFLVEGVLGDDDRPKNGTIGWPERDGGTTRWVRASEIQHRLRDSFSSRRPSETDRANLALADRTKRLTRAELEWADFVKRQRWTGTPTLLLQAIPPVQSPQLMPRFYEIGGPAQSLRQPSSLRQVGWNLYGRGQMLEEDSAVLYVDDPRRAIRLDSDGMFTVAGTATPDFLAWSANKEPSDTAIINPFPLAEYAYEFFRFTHSVLRPELPGGWEFRAAVRNFVTPTRVVLQPGISVGFPSALEHGGAPPNSSESPLCAMTTAVDDLTSFLTWFYALFALPASSIPFFVDGVFSESAFLSAARRG